MLQITLAEPGQWTAQRVATPNDPSGLALVRVHRVGICGTDLHAFAGRQPFFTYPRVLGHELAVEVLSAPENSRGIRAGQMCAVEPYLSCGKCYACSIGRTNCCRELQCLGVHCDGGMRGQIVLPVSTLYPSTELSLDQLALVETLGIGAHAVQRAEIVSGESVLVVGAGPIGLATIQFALAAGANVRVLELNPFRRDFVKSLGVATLSEYDDQLSPIVFDATGHSGSMEACFNYVQHAGRLVFVGLTQQKISFENPNFHRRELSVLSSRNSAGLFPKIMEMIVGGQIDTRPWITHRLTLAEVPEKFATIACQTNLVKAMIELTASDW